MPTPSVPLSKQVDPAWDFVTPKPVTEPIKVDGGFIEVPRDLHLSAYQIGELAKYVVRARAAGKAIILHDGLKWRPDVKPVALDVSLEKARALHRVWRALNDGDCPKCHAFHAATDIVRTASGIGCPSCSFVIYCAEIEAIEKEFAPAMDAAVAIFEEWRIENKKQEG